MQGLGRLLKALPEIHPAAWAVVAVMDPIVLPSRGC